MLSEKSFDCCCIKISSFSKQDSVCFNWPHSKIIRIKIPPADSFNLYYLVFVCVSQENVGYTEIFSTYERYVKDCLRIY